MLAELIGLTLLVAMIAYVLTGGADFGGGVWDLFASGPRKAAQREVQRREKLLGEVEARIAVLEVQLAGLVREMQDPALATDHARLYPLIDRHAALQAELDDQLARWEALHEELGEAG